MNAASKILAIANGQITPVSPIRTVSPVDPLPTHIHAPVQDPSTRLMLRADYNEKHGDNFELAETMRIVNLPTIQSMDAAEFEAFNQSHIQAYQYEKGFRLLWPQANGLAAYEAFGGLFGAVGCGWGKTLLGLMCAAHATAKGMERIVLFVPPPVLSQLVQVDIPWARSRVNINFNIHILGGRDMAFRRALCASRRKGLYIFPYSLLSARDASENLKNIWPGLIIADEVHNLANKDAARTKRVIALLEEQNKMGQPPEMVVMSGTITSKSIKQYYHLIKPTLKTNCPLPLSTHLTNDWAQMIDADASTAESSVPQRGNGPIMPLVLWAQKQFPNEPGGFPSDVFGFRRAYKKRLTSAPGVVSSGDATIGTSLIMTNTPVENMEASPGYDRLKALVDQVNQMWLTPNGDEIEHAIHCWKWLNELSAGFYNELTWPTPEVYAKRKGMDESEAKIILEMSVVHHTAGQTYANALRKWLDGHSRSGLDTPFLVGADMARYGPKNVGKELYTLWDEWKRLDFEGRPDRDSRAVRVCPFKINHAADWVTKHLAENPGVGCIVWYYHQEIGRWLTDVLRERGITSVLHCPQGEDANMAILDHSNGNRVIVASMTAHGTGKNLQHFQHQLFVQWPRDARQAEQVIGRTHRNGQKADELTVYTCMTNLFDQLNFAACLNDALYIHQTTGNRQKLIYANYDPLPKIFPPAVLVEKGLDVVRLDREQEQALKDKFGEYAK